MPPAFSVSWNSAHAASQSCRVSVSMPPEPAAGSADLGEIGFFQQHKLGVARHAPRERIGQAERQRVRQHGDGIGAAEAGGESRHGRAQHVHIGIALGQHSPRRLRIDEDRFWRKAAGLLDPRPERSERPELCQRQELIGIGTEPER